MAAAKQTAEQTLAGVYSLAQRLHELVTILQSTTLLHPTVQADLLRLVGERVGPGLRSAATYTARLEALATALLDANADPGQTLMGVVYTGGRLRGKGASKVPSHGIWPLTQARRLLEQRPGRWLWVAVCVVEGVSFTVTGESDAGATPNLWTSV